MPAPRAALPVEAPEVPRVGSHGCLVLEVHSVGHAPEEPLPRGAVALGDGSDVELLRGDFSEWARVAWGRRGWRDGMGCCGLSWAGTRWSGTALLCVATEALLLRQDSECIA